MAYQIRVNCTCGKILKIPEKYAGKKGRCPNCGNKISIPSLEEIQQGQPPQKETPPSDKTCPTCGAYINPGDTVCVSCHTNLKTGEWDAETEGFKELTPLHGNLKIVAAFTILGVLVLIALSVVVYRWLNRGQPIVVPPVNPAVVESPKPSDLNPIQSVLDMPESDVSALDQKIKAMANFLEIKAGSQTMQTYQQLLAKKAELQVQAEFNKLGKENVFAMWLQVNKLLAQYGETTFAKETLMTEQKSLEQQMIAHIRRQAEDAQEALTSKSYEQLLEKTLAGMLDLLNQAYSAPEFSKESQAWIEINRKALQEMQAQQEQIAAALAAAQPSKELEKIELENTKKEFNDFLAKYREYCGQWRFQEAFTKLQPLALKAEELKAKYPEETELKKVTETFQEVKLLNKVWDYAVEGAASLKGKTTLLFNKRGKPIAGTVTKYEEGKLYITKDQQAEVVHLIDLSSRSIGTLALLHNDKNPDPYVCLTAFYYMNGEETACNESAETAIKLGVAPALVEQYQKWASGVLEEKKKRLDQQRQLSADEQKQQEQKQEEIRLEKLRQDAWALVRQLLQEYRLNKDAVVLEYLYTLKTKIGDRPNGRDELVKINFEVKKIEGQALSTIASNAYSRCAFCRNSGYIKCPDCHGDGYIQGEDRWLGKDDKSYKIEGKKKFCERCKGKTEIDCPYCYEKKQNRRYMMIKDYYGNF